MIHINRAEKVQASDTACWFITGPDIPSAISDPAERAMAERYKTAKRSITSFPREKGGLMLVFTDTRQEVYGPLESARRAGNALALELKSLKQKNILLRTDAKDAALLLAFAEGVALGAYQFNVYKKEKPEIALQEIQLEHTGLDDKDLADLNALVHGVWLARDLVNEPASTLTAEELSERIQQCGKDHGFKTEILNKLKIEALKMGGLLSVAAGSIDPPTFNVMEYKPDGAVNARPIILVGKGVVFDTGGLTLKPTPGSMDLMKSDMAGAAAVIGAMCAIAEAKLPVYVVALVPATDNRPGERATAPGDVIFTMDGTSIEVLNTDAEGRLILADALTYAKKYDPELVLDLATLTGAAARAIGQQGIVFMGTAEEQDKTLLQESGRQTYERLVEFPLWEEYGDMIKSDIADLKNVASGASAGAITAGKFLEHFTDFPWLHLDIAGPAFLTAPDSYRGKNGSGVGVRLLFDFVKRKYLK